MLFVVLFMFSAVIIVSEATDTPACSPDSPNIFFPVEGDCNKYMKCAKGVVSTHVCPAGRYFNPENWHCDDPANVKCNQNNLACGLNAQNVFLPVKGDCSKYTRCDNGIINTYDCPAGLYFNLETFVCDYPQNVNCDQDIPTCSPDSPNIFFPVKGDCNKYMKCAKGVISTHVCPAGMYFNPENWHCDDSANVKCNQDTPACSPNSPNTFFPVKGDCNKYMKCAKGVVSTHVCPAGRYFNPENWQCDDPANVQCNQDTSVCNSDAENIYFPVQGDCSKFKRCDNGVLNTYECPAGLRFNLDISVCDYPENVQCN